MSRHLHPTDVDDLKEGRGGEYVDISAQMLVFVSDGYFMSPNCMRELLRAYCMRKPIIPVCEINENKGGLKPSVVLERLHEASELYEAWGLAAEMREWRKLTIEFRQPTAQELYDMLKLEGSVAAGGAIYWERYACLLTQWDLACAHMATQ